MSRIRRPETFEKIKYVVQSKMAVIAYVKSKRYSYFHGRNVNPRYRIDSAYTARDHLWPLYSTCTALQRQRAVTAHLKSKQLLLFVFVQQCRDMSIRGAQE